MLRADSWSLEFWRQGAVWQGCDVNSGSGTDGERRKGSGRESGCSLFSLLLWQTMEEGEEDQRHTQDGERLMRSDTLSHVQLFCDPMDCRPPGSSVHWISQARILESVAIPFSRRSSQPRDCLLHLLHCRQILPAMQETPVQFLGWEDTLEKG